MATTAQFTMRGRETGSNRQCTECGGLLRTIGGTDAEKAQEQGGFRETYECTSCGAIGDYYFRDVDAKETYTGACAGEVPL